MKSLDLIASHLVGDYVLQTNEEAVKKFTERDKLTSHVLKYTLAFVPCVLGSKVGRKRKVSFLALLALSHYLTDRKRWASGSEWPPKPILVDQTIHAVTLSILGRLL
jgi:hypothetical protein